MYMHVREQKKKQYFPDYALVIFMSVQRCTWVTTLPLARSKAGVAVQKCSLIYCYYQLASQYNAKMVLKEIKSQIPWIFQTLRRCLHNLKGHPSVYHLGKCVQNLSGNPNYLKWQIFLFHLANLYRKVLHTSGKTRTRTDRL